MTSNRRVLWPGASFGSLALLIYGFLVGSGGDARPAEVTYPQLIRVRYEAQDPKVGGHFLIWVEREKIWYGLDSRLYPTAKSVEVSHVTPAAGSPALTIIAVTGLNATTPDYFHLSGIVRFKVTGMVIKSTNVP
jgi:hypothetical protein